MNDVLFGLLVTGGSFLAGLVSLMLLTFAKGKRLNVLMFGEEINNPFISQRTILDIVGIEICFVVLWPLFLLGWLLGWTIWKTACMMNGTFEKIANARANAKLPPINTQFPEDWKNK